MFAADQQIRDANQNSDDLRVKVNSMQPNVFENFGTISGTL
jgi:hypothetical protein